MIAVLLVLTVVSDVTCRSVVGFTPSPTPVAQIVSVTEKVTSSPTESPLHLFDDTYESHPDYPDCDGYLAFIGDGDCDGLENNNAECGWDGGDCCECTCQSTATYDCGISGFDCKDPSMQLLFEVTDCRNASLIIPKASTCPQDVQLEWVVNDTAAATLLAETVLCSGGNFEVDWTGHVNVTRTIYLHDEASLRITGTSDAVADGGGMVQVLVVSNGYLYLKSLEIANGNASDGGAIFVASESELFLEGVSFNSNTAKGMGGAVYAASSTITLVSTTFNYNTAGYGGAVFALNSTVTGSVNVFFHGNRADYDGGAVFVQSSIVIGSGNMTLTNNYATENGGALYIERSSYVGWNMHPVFSSTSPSSNWSDEDNSINLSFTSPSSYAYMPYPHWNEAEWIVDESNIGDTIVVFENNIAKGVGGAIYAEDSQISWSGSMLLKQNSAQYGGAFYLKNDVIFKQEA